jgi:RNA polymerase sigma-70 factor (ECF subfamily)
LLRDVLGFSAREVGEILETTPASIDSALQRAHKTVESRLPAQSQQATLSSLGDEGLRELVDRFVQAWEKADVSALVAMLSDDARFTMPPQREWYAGRDAIALFLATQPLRAGHRWRAMPLTANGQLALAQYISLSESEPYTAAAICVLTLDGGQIAEATAFRMPEVFARFGLPDTLSD